LDLEITEILNLLAGYAKKGASHLQKFCPTGDAGIDGLLQSLNKCQALSEEEKTSFIKRKVEMVRFAYLWEDEEW